MKHYSSRRFWFETAMATASGALLLVTLVWRDWIETLFGVDPDQHNGSLEWFIVGGLLVLTVVLFSVARTELRKPRAVPA
jgi:hypothetical protein